MKTAFLIFFLIIAYSAHSQITCNNWLHTPSRYSYVDIGELDVTGNQITVEAVINRTQPYVPGGADNTEGNIVSKHDNPNDVNYLLRPNHAFITTDKGFFQTPDIPDIQLNKTFHVAMVYDGITLKFYRNGCLMSQIAASGNLFQNSWHTRIGYYENQIWNTNFIGYINEVRIWNVVRTQAQIQAYMNTSLPNPTTQTGLLAYYTFDNLLNKQGNAAYNGTLNGSASINQTNTSCNSIINLCNSPDSIIINEYTEVLNFDPCKNELIVANASKYNAGDTVLMIQMKGAVIDSTNTATFGTITDYKNSGNYEYNIVKQKNGNRLSLLYVLERNYDIPDGKVQLVRVPYYQNVDINAPLTCLPWDGSKGGVLAFNVAGNINMGADIDVSGRGFRHGLPMNNTADTRNEQQYFYSVSTNEGAQKGESIYSISDVKNYGRGAPANGGGGGNAHNTGGGGGGNGGSGGLGGDQWQAGKTIAENVGGKGGKALTYTPAINKLFLGGSGGMGQANNQREYPAGNGGGIIIISAGSLTSNGFAIKSNGNNATESPNSAECKDGMAGGGAGGTILLGINSLTITSIVEARGGKGADHIAKNELHGPGGGGGGGVIAFGQPTVLPQYSTNISGGANGVNTNHANNAWGATSGSNGKILTSFIPHIDNQVFKQNIDSVRFTEDLHDCMSFDFNGLAFTQISPLTDWNWDFGDANTSTLQNPVHTYATTGNYNVKLVGIDINGCKDSILKTVSVMDISITKSPDTVLCGSSPVQIFATGGSTYSWSPAIGLNNPNIANPVATPLVSTKYYVTVSNPGGCSKMDSVFIQVNNVPTITKSNDTVICVNSQAPLFATGGSSYNWSPVSSLSNSNIGNPVATPKITTTYQVTVTNADGCTKIDSIKVGIHPIPVIIKSNDSTICNNGSVQLFVSGGNSYVWSPASSLDNYTSATPVASPSSTTEYHVQITDAYSCIFIDTVRISVSPAAVFSVSPDNSVCAGSPQQLIATGGDSYSWSPATFLDNPNANNPVATPDATITYSVTIKENTCNETATLYTQLTALPAPLVSATKSNDLTCSEPSSQLTATGAQTYSWFPSEGLDNASTATPLAYPSLNTLYTVTGKDVNGCEGTDTVSVKVNFNGNVFYGLPNSFTPNGDGLNDCFGVSPWGQVDELDFSIYNRYGQRIFHTANSADCWDGTFKGKIQNSAAFVYIIKGKTTCGIINKKGVILLIR